MNSLIGFLKCAEEVARRLSAVHSGMSKARLLSLADVLKAQANSLSREVL
jgi:hypothetical protein